MTKLIFKLKLWDGSSLQLLLHHLNKLDLFWCFANHAPRPVRVSTNWSWCASSTNRVSPLYTSSSSAAIDRASIPCNTRREASLFHETRVIVSFQGLMNLLSAVHHLLIQI